MRFLIPGLQIAAKNPIVEQKSKKSDERTLASLVTLALSCKPHQRATPLVGNSLTRPLSSQSGFTLIEIAMVIAVVGILSAFAFVSFGNADESRDATMIQAVQGSLQSIVSQGAIRMDQRPDQLDSSAVLTALRSTLNQDTDTSGSIRASASGGTYNINIPQKNRSATFNVASNGDVQLTGLSNFTRYSVDKSRTPWTIKKGN
jgi:prepilin-type N-terminal cleavage/methylation domain-containing protein